MCSLLEPRFKKSVLLSLDPIDYFFPLCVEFTQGDKVTSIVTIMYKMIKKIKNKNKCLRDGFENSKRRILAIYQ